MADNHTSSSTRDNTAYIGGRIDTVNVKQPWVEAFIVRSDGYVTAVGSGKDIEVKVKDEKMAIYKLQG